jgi:hypothetical protein
MVWNASADLVFDALEPVRQLRVQFPNSNRTFNHLRLEFGVAGKTKLEFLQLEDDIRDQRLTDAVQSTRGIHQGGAQGVTAFQLEPEFVNLEARGFGGIPKDVIVHSKSSLYTVSYLNFGMIGLWSLEKASRYSCSFNPRPITTRLERPSWR